MDLVRIHHKYNQNVKVKVNVENMMLFSEINFTFLLLEEMLE